MLAEDKIQIDLMIGLSVIFIFGSKVHFLSWLVSRG